MFSNVALRYLTKHNLLKKIFLYLFLLVSVFSCVKDEIDIPVTKRRTILVYLAGDNNLYKEVSEMQKALMKGWNPKTDGSLVILADQTNSSTPMLIKIQERKNKIVADTLRRYSLENSASPELLGVVIADTKLLAPGSSYGMVLFSHATGWLPEKAFDDPARWGVSIADTPKVMRRSIFVDKGREMELADFAAAIPDGMFEFMAFDMCFMSSVETAYALRNKTKYLLAAAPEVLAPGFTPIYSTSLNLLYKTKPDLEGFAQAFYDYFNGLQGLYQSAAISVVRTSEMEALATLTRQIAPSLASPNVRDIAAPRLVWATDAELTIQSIRNIWPLYCGLFVGVRPWLFADQSQLTHQSANLEPPDQNAFVIEHCGNHPASCRASTLAEYPVYIGSQNYSLGVHYGPPTAIFVIAGP